MTQTHEAASSTQAVPAAAANVQRPHLATTSEATVRPTAQRAAADLLFAALGDLDQLASVLEGARRLMESARVEPMSIEDEEIYMRTLRLLALAKAATLGLRKEVEMGSGKRGLLLRADVFRFTDRLLNVEAEIFGASVTIECVESHGASEQMMSAAALIGLALECCRLKLIAALDQAAALLPVDPEAA
jgi:hypothetical protein